jgi:DNA-binding beta-propeller fold protein YncE
MTGGGERTWIVAVVAGALVVVVGVLAIAGVFSGDGGGDAPAGDFGDISAEPAPPPPEPTVRRIEVGGRPDSIAAGGGYVWVGDSFGGKLNRLNPASKKPIPVEPAGFPTDIAADDGGAWLALADRGAVQRVTADEGALPPVKQDGFPFGVALGDEALWSLEEGDVTKLSPVTGRPAGTVFGFAQSASSIAAGEGGVWVARDNREVARFQSNGETLEPEVAQVPGAFNVTVGEGAAWVLGAAGTLTRLDPRSGAIAGEPVQVSEALDVAAGLGYVWVANGEGQVFRFDPDTGLQVGEPIEVGPLAQAIAVGEDSAWVADSRDGGVYRITP